MLFEISQQADIVHAHNIHAPTAFIAHIARRFCRKLTFVVSPYYHGRGQTEVAQLLWIPYRSLVKRILESADAVIVNSKVQKALLKEAFGSISRTFVVYDGVKLNEIKNAEPFTINSNIKIVVYVGRLEKYKNVHVMVGSMKHLPTNYHLYIIGSGSHRLALERLTRSLNLQDRVHFLGFQPDEVVHRWLKTAHVFVHPSAVESFGMTCIESLAAGTPVIANDDGLGLSETIALYPNHIMAYKVNKEPIARLSRLVMEVAELKPIIADVARFSWDLIAEKTSHVYKQILIK
jgi:glycosyltransferase involved in cell wall biosynthesis